METQENHPVGKLGNPKQLSTSSVAQIIKEKNNTGDISLKPSQALCMHVLKKNAGKFISTYIFRAEGVSHPAGRIQELSEKGVPIDRHYGPALDEHGIEHARCAYYKLSNGGV